MENVMTLAWNVRRNASVKWNCGVMEILFDACLKMAHKGEKIMNDVKGRVELTHEQLINKIKQYDNVHNEGGDGYNPYKEELSRRQFEYEKNRVKSPEEQKYALLKEIAALDCSIARESGSYDADRISALRSQIEGIEAKQDAAFLDIWTLEITKSRRIEWNTFASAAMANHSRKELPAVITKKQRELGWGMDDLRKAVKIHNL